MLTEKQEIIVVTKTDLLEPEVLAKRIKKLKTKSPILTVSTIDTNSLNDFKKKLSALLKDSVDN